MNNVISFERRSKNVKQNEMERPLIAQMSFHDRNWLCGEKKYAKDLKHAVDLYGFTKDEQRFTDISKLVEYGVEENFNLLVCAKCGREDHDIELELVRDGKGLFYYAVYTDSIQANRSARHSYYNVGYKLPMNYLFNSIKAEKVINGICLNPFSGTPVILTRGEISKICDKVCG